jgi:hypothetical protein
MSKRMKLFAIIALIGGIIVAAPGSAFAQHSHHGGSHHGGWSGPRVYFGIGAPGYYYGDPYYYAPPPPPPECDWEQVQVWSPTGTGSGATSSGAIEARRA